MHTRRTRLLSSLLTTTLLAGLGACVADDELELELDADEALRSGVAYYVELDNVAFTVGNSLLELDEGQVEEVTPTHWHLRLSANDISGRDCIRDNDKVWLRNGPIGTNAQHYTTTNKKWSYALGFSETWRIVDAVIADPGGCLAPGDSFKLRSNYSPNPYLSDQPITLGAGDGHAIYDNGSVLEYNDVTLLRGGEYFHRGFTTWVTHSTRPWSIRTVEPTLSGCVEADSTVFVGFAGSPTVYEREPYYSPWGMSAGWFSWSTWDLVPVDIASPDNCLAPGDRFKLRSNADNSWFHGGEVITYEADNQHDRKFVPELLDLDGVSAAGGQVILNQSWFYVQLPPGFVNPVVIAGPATTLGSDPTGVRLRNVTSQGFEIRLQEWDYLDGTHGPEAVDYLVVESGHHVTDGGVVIQAGRFVADGRLNKTTAIKFWEDFEQTPKLFTTIQSYEGLDAVTPQVTQVGTRGLEMLMVEQESRVDGHMNEMVGYLALSGTPAGTPYQTHQTVSLEVNHVMTSVQVGNQLYWLHLDEEQSADAETAHPSQWVDVFRVVLDDATKLTFAQAVTYNGEDPFSIRCAPWSC